MLLKKKILCLSGDLTSSCEVDQFGINFQTNLFNGYGWTKYDEFCWRIIYEWFIPFIHTFGVFTYRRPYDQLLASIAYPRRKYELWVFFRYTTPAGMTHQAIEDISIMRTIPNMTVIETGDAIVEAYVSR